LTAFKATLLLVLVRYGCSYRNQSRVFPLTFIKTAAEKSPYEISNSLFLPSAQNISSRRGTGNSGLIAITNVGQSVLERTAVFISDEFVEVRFIVGLPACGRQIAGRQAAQMLCDDIPQIVDQAIKYQSLDAAAIKHHVETVEDADWLRQQLAVRGLVAFIPDGAILPRRSGVDDQALY
jgi:predicted ABC-class ATPase